MNRQQKLDAVRSTIEALEQQLLAARQAYAQIEQFSDRPNPLPAQVDIAMHFVALYQQSTRPMFDENLECFQRDPEPKERSA